MKAELKKLESQIRELNLRRNAIKEAEDSAKALAYLGKCYRFQNNYSCPEKPSDYWFGYVKVTGANGGHLNVLKFERRNGGRVDVHEKEFCVPFTLDGYEEITKVELDRQWGLLMRHLARIAP